jgi:hypothetical protein
VGLLKYQLNKATTVDKLFKVVASSGLRSVRNSDAGDLGQELLNPLSITAKS